MARDGFQTRQRILEAACDIFSQKGYRRSTVAEICRCAGANIAAVNYHFKSKTELYRAVWLHLFESAAQLYPLDGGLAASASAPAEALLKAHIRALVSRRFDQGRIGLLHGLWMMEMVNPTGLIEEWVDHLVDAQRQKVIKTIGLLVGPGADEQLLAMCEMSLFSQCRMVRPDGTPPGLARQRGREEITPEDKDRLIDHIYKFSLAGLKAARRPLERAEVVTQ